MSDGQAAQGMPTRLWDPQAAPALGGPAQQSAVVGSTAILGHCSARLGEERVEAPFLLLPSLLLKHTDFFLLVISPVQTVRAVENGWEPRKALSQGRGSVACSAPFLIPVQLLSLGRAAVH